MKTALRSLLSLPLFVAVMLMSGCAGESQGIQSSRVAATSTSIQSEAPGDYYIGRRYFKPQYKFWGYVRRPGQPWSTSQLVMLNEKQKLAPDRAANRIGSDNNYEYKLHGQLSEGKPVYEPASNGMYPEFVLKSYELVSSNPPPIFRAQRGGRAQTPPNPNAIEKPE